jgi:hypothetical protein
LSNKQRQIQVLWGLRLTLFLGALFKKKKTKLGEYLFRGGKEITKNFKFTQAPTTTNIIKSS